MHECRYLVCSSAWRPAESPVSGSEGNTSKPEGHSWIHCSGVCLCPWLQNLLWFMMDSVFPHQTFLTLFVSGPQHYASRGGHLSVCSFLLEVGACASPQTPGGATPLHRAAYCGHADVARLLLQHRADPRLRDGDGATPLHKVQNRQPDMNPVQLMVSNLLLI